MSNWIMNFIRDERGAESVEFGVTAVVIAGGAVAGTDDLQDAVKQKTADTVTKLGEATF
jgi:Flp pilus assembly pilin Flp